MIEASHLYGAEKGLKFLYDDQENDYKVKKEYAVIPQSLFLEHMNIKENQRYNSEFIILKFDYDVKNLKNTVLTKEELRLFYYTNGVEFSTKNKKVKYVPLYRTSNKAKAGKIIFIQEVLFKKAWKYLTMGLCKHIDPDDEVKLVELTAYASLSTAAAEHFITIPFKNILIIDDLTVKAKRDRAVANVFNDGEKICLEYLQNGSAMIKNTIFDGQSLIDEKFFHYDDSEEQPEGFIYTRNHFWKSCMFVGKIQEFFKDYYGEDYDSAIITDYFGKKHFAKDIRVIASKNSIKWLKFIDLMGGTLESAYDYYAKKMDKYGNRFAVVKTGHESHYGDYQKSSYQMMNTLPSVDMGELAEVAETTIDYFNGLSINENFLDYLRVYENISFKPNKALIDLAEHYPAIMQTRFFKDFKSNLKAKFKKEIKGGKFLFKAANLTIVHNPVRMLQCVAGNRERADDSFQIHDDYIECYTERFAEGELLAGFRSPHNSPSNIICLKNIRNKLFDTYFPNLGRTVIVINADGTDVQQRLSGSDTDSDFLYVTNEKMVADLAKRAYVNFPTIVNSINETGEKRYRYNRISIAEIDNQISGGQNDIGESSNLAQLALSYWFESGMTDKKLEEIFLICSVLAQISIDSAKKSFDIDVGRYIRQNSFLYRKSPKPYFYALNKGGKAKKEYVNCPMDILIRIFENNAKVTTEYKTFRMDLSVLCSRLTEINERSYYRNLKKIEELHKTYQGIEKSKHSDEKKYRIKEHEFERLISRIRSSFKDDPEGTMRQYVFYLLTKCGFKNRMLAVLYGIDRESLLKIFGEITVSA